MTGIERLRDIAYDGPYSGGMVHISVTKLREICEQIEGEGGVETVKREAMDALAFVEEKGGLAELERRLMPEGIEWPRYDTGEPVHFGDELEHEEQGHRFKVDTFEFMKDGWRACYENGSVRDVYRPGERIKRPPVRAADGKPLEVGETVYDINDSHGYPGTVVSTELDGLGHVKVACEEPTPASVSIRPSRLTHERPVADTWERLWMDMHPVDESECVGLDRDEFVLRAKALAEKEG